MRKLLLMAALLVPLVGLADPREHRDHDREHHEWHERGGHFGWGEFVGGLVLGGIIAHEINGHYYDSDEYEVRRVTVCNDIPLFDQNGNYVRTERRCHDEWVRL